MKYPWLDDYLQQKAGVTKDLQPDWNWIRYLLGGKMFAAVCLDEDNKPYYITLKLEPSEGDFLRTQYADIVPGYYMNKVHWNVYNTWFVFWQIKFLIFFLIVKCHDFIILPSFLCGF